MWNKFVYASNWFLKVLSKNNPRTHSPKQNKKAMLTTSTFLKVAETIIAFFLPSVTKMSVSSKNWKSEHHHWILHIRISLSIKF